METLLNIGTATLFWLVLAIFFVCASIAAWLFVQKGESFWGEYEDIFMETSSANLSDMFLFVDTKRLFLFNIIAMILIPLISYMMSSSLITSIVVLVVIMFLPFRLYRRMRKKRLAKIEKQLPDALVMISGTLAAGGSLAMALDAVVKDQPAPISQEFMLFTREQRIGVEFEKSLRNMERRIPNADLIMFTSALKISREVGGDLSDVINTLAETLRRKSTMEGKIESLTSQGKMQGIVMTALPIMIGGILFFIEPVAMQKLFTTNIGWVVVSVVVVMEALGYFFISKVTNINV
ncbi:MAG: tight adherence protein B [Cellvibrionaceae bacterium]|jgi:tight adherence protein B